MIEDVIWTAGILDGEGSICLRKLKSRKTASGFPAYSLLVSVGVRRDRDLSTFKELYGGNIGDWEKDGSQPAHSWTITGGGVLSFLRTVYPYLKWKREEAGIGMAYQMYVEDKKAAGHQSFHVTKEEDKFRESLYLRLRELNHKKIRGGQNEVQNHVSGNG